MAELAAELSMSLEQACFGCPTSKRTTTTPDTGGADAHSNPDTAVSTPIAENAENGIDLPSHDSRWPDTEAAETRRFDLEKPKREGIFASVKLPSDRWKGANTPERAPDRRTGPGLDWLAKQKRDP
ncbi:hypothetical protein ACIHAX_36605 [Nocardia sp. NPDC051929]|uniref:hypothetical protein n=1 Tax=unclassified Nocardia TaxID=2637762 RepID=UPI003412F961